MPRSISVEVTFVATFDAGQPVDAVAAEGVVRMPDETLQAFSGWIELLSLLEAAAGRVEPSRRKANGRASRDHDRAEDREPAGPT